MTRPPTTMSVPQPPANLEVDMAEELCLNTSIGADSEYAEAIDGQMELLDHAGSWPFMPFLSELEFMSTDLSASNPIV